jgi:uncharacterized protein (DUF1499 family)
MKILLWLVLIPAALIGAYFTILSWTAKPQDLGIAGGRLLFCPNTPNCVCSEDPNPRFNIAPLVFQDAPASAWNRLRKVVLTAGGKIQNERDGYLHATFTSRIFHFVDDVEFRLVAVDSRIHMRSASRIGYSDFGVNRKRMEQLRTLFERSRG